MSYLPLCLAWCPMPSFYCRSPLLILNVLHFNINGDLIIVALSLFHPTAAKHSDIMHYDMSIIIIPNPLTGFLQSTCLLNLLHLLHLIQGMIMVDWSLFLLWLPLPMQSLLVTSRWVQALSHTKSSLFLNYISFAILTCVNSIVHIPLVISWTPCLPHPLCLIYCLWLQLCCQTIGHCVNRQAPQSLAITTGRTRTLPTHQMAFPLLMSKTWHISGLVGMTIKKLQVLGKVVLMSTLFAWLHTL